MQHPITFVLLILAAPGSAIRPIDEISLDELQANHTTSSRRESCGNPLVIEFVPAVEMEDAAGPEQVTKKEWHLEPLFEHRKDWHEGKRHHMTKVVYKGDCDNDQLIGITKRFDATTRRWTIDAEVEPETICVAGMMCPFGTNIWRPYRTIDDLEHVRLYMGSGSKAAERVWLAGRYRFGISNAEDGLEAKVQEEEQNPSEGNQVVLESVAGYKKKDIPQGCYCCKSSYVFSPFEMAWSVSKMDWVQGPGKRKCMLAWRMIGNAVERDSRGRMKVNQGGAGTALMLPEFVLAIANTFTFSVGQHGLCALTCPFRKKPDFEEFQYSFTKVLR